MVTLSRWLQKRAYYAYVASEIVDWLNANLDKEGYRRVLQAYRRAMRFDHLARLMRQKRYRGSTMADYVMGKPTDEPVGIIRAEDEGKPYLLILQHIVWLANRGQFVRLVRQCRCRKWFVGTRRGRKSCSTRCREARYKSTNPEFKRKRAKYMREYRAAIKKLKRRKRRASR